ncbi:uncharacterized protein BYT42DRAFT_572947 [Radiomyces spectabilis]|uniref:uncharacterized protein n=1 Tax=Radiomyces spectabilis TaxID=64574 RepID=UPI002220489B|nr:uncharacterized protein BYT42DRAFT_572947 [Radiomyces spectabilis]KAI8375970.1 hypothetical protein BYT42DRAFT_572947 [Radiomyces spectabilis]
MKAGSLDNICIPESLDKPISDMTSSRAIGFDEMTPAAEELIRIRKHSETGPLHQRFRKISLAETSLHSFRFSSSINSHATNLVDMRQSILSRSAAFMKRKEDGESSPIRYHSSTYHSPKLDDIHNRVKTKSAAYGYLSQFADKAGKERHMHRQKSDPSVIKSNHRHRQQTPVTPDEGEPVMDRLARTLSSSSSILSDQSDTSSTISSSSERCSSSSRVHRSYTTKPKDVQRYNRSFTGDRTPTRARSFSHRRSSLMPIIQPRLHHPTRFLPQHHAVITTHVDWRISVANSIAASVLGGAYVSSRELINRSILDFIDPSYRTHFIEWLVRRREALDLPDDNAGGRVLACGEVLPILKQDGSKSAASLWLKEKKSGGSSVYIWIFEEVFQSIVHATVNAQGAICEIEDAVRELYAYEPAELLGQPLDVLIPSLAGDGLDRWGKMNQLKFFGSKTKLGSHFPVIAKAQAIADSTEAASSRFSVRITSIPTLAGLMTVRQDGTIEGCNTVFGKYMFGFSEKDLLHTNKRMADLMPQFPALLHAIRRDDLLHHGCILNNLICRKIIADTDNTPYSQYLRSVAANNPRGSSQEPFEKDLPFMIAIHRDGTPFEVQIQLKLLEDSDDLIALWIIFDREATFARFGRTSGSQAVLPPVDGASPLPSLQESQSLPSTTPSVAHPTTPMTIKKPPRPPLTTMPSFAPPTPVKERSLSELYQALPAVAYSAQTRATDIKDYVILDDLGQGAYGLVKLAVHKDDPEKTKVVIKYVIKSRILLDCWTRDRKLGTVPVEVHILHTLRKIPHPYCTLMTDYFEDEDHYYIVMPLHGDGMDLFDYIELKPHMAESEIKSIFRQVAEAVQHLHDHSIVHRDIKDENVIIDDAGVVRLIDFGSAAYMKAGRRFDTCVGTLDYSSPEVLRGQTYEGPPQDIWSLGILLYTLIFRETPFYSVDEILEHDLDISKIPFAGPVKLISSMLSRDLTQRPTIEAVLQDEWLR